MCRSYGYSRFLNNNFIQLFTVLTNRIYDRKECCHVSLNSYLRTVFWFWCVDWNENDICIFNCLLNIISEWQVFLLDCLSIISIEIWFIKWQVTCSPFLYKALVNITNLELKCWISNSHCNSSETSNISSTYTTYFKCTIRALLKHFICNRFHSN